MTPPDGQIEPAQDLLASLTDEQRLAAETTEGPVLVVAAAGSGKTRVITRRIAHLISMGIPSWQILALTFTNKAAGEMRERVELLLADAGMGERVRRGLTVTTFHALCARLLRRYAPMMEGAPRWGIHADYTIYDTDDQVALMKGILKEMNLESSRWPPRTVLSVISDAKNRLEDAEEFEKSAMDFYSRSVAKIFSAYEKGLRLANAVDFDDLLTLTVRLLRECEEARTEVQQRWRYLMIDEYQDTNHAQFVLATLLCGRDEETGDAPNIFVVGDPDQSIYGWRGADITNILEFGEHYPGAKVIRLGQNFRSTAPILKVADTLIRNNKKRIHKDLYTSDEGGDAPEVVLCADEHHEARLAVDWFKKLHEEGALTWKDMAVFYRNNALSRVMEDALRTANVPYVIARGTAFYQREEVRDLLAYLRVLANPSDDVSLKRIVNKPARKIGKTSLSRVEEEASMQGRPIMEALRTASSIAGLSPAATKAMAKFVTLFDEWSQGGTFMGTSMETPLSDLVSRVLVQSGLQAHYRAAAERSEGDAEKPANLDELVSAAAEFEERYDPSADPALQPLPDGSPPETPPLLAMLRAFLESVALVADADKVDPAAGAVTLMTLHAAKGLEFGAAAMIGLEEGLLPSARALEEDPEGEEERRLCFVGITRAMRHLIITCAKYRTIRGLRERTVPSRFLSELPQDSIRVSDQSEAFEEFEYWDDDEPRAPSTGASRAPRRAPSSSSGAGSPARKRELAQLAFGVGSNVRHAQFGIGEVKSISGAGVNLRATIAFRDVGTKTLVLQYAKLTPV